MQDNFEQSLKVVLKSEGFYSDDPRDPGAATNFGVTQAVYTAYRHVVHMPSRSVREIEAFEVREVFRVQYWDRIHGNDLAPGVDLFMFDYAVNSGPAAAVKALQTVLGVKSDGVLGLKTLHALMQFKPDTVLDGLAKYRLSFLQRLKTWSTFGRGWKSRVIATTQAAKLIA